MRAFSQFLDDLVYTRSRNTKLRLIGDYLKATPDPDRGLALTTLTGTLDIPAVKPAVVRALAEERIDPVLLRMSRDYVGDMAETVSLLWPAPEGEPSDLDDGTITVGAAVERLRAASRSDAPRVLASMLDHLDTSGRFALLKLATGTLRVGISARLAKQALANAFGLDVEQVEEVWHGLHPPFTELFDWGEGRAEQPTAKDMPVFRPFMLAHPLEETKVDLADDFAANWAAEWKRDPLTADCVMMYAQRGPGKRSSFYSDYTFGCWTGDGELLPVGKAYLGFTGEELKWLDKFVRGNTLNRFGPVREVEKTLVLEVAVDSIHKSTRHKSGLAMRFPRIARIRTDKPAHEADRIETLLAEVT